MNKLALLKLTSGEEVVAELYHDDENKEAWILYKPFSIVDAVTPQGLTLALRPFIRCMPPGMQEKVSVDYKHIITMLEVPDGMEKAYLQQRSGLDLATPANSIIKPS